jgi:hypothetical protein
MKAQAIGKLGKSFYHKLISLDAFACMFVFLFSLVLGVAARNFLDIDSTWDEANYLKRGLEYGTSGSLPPPSWAPVYSIWYAVVNSMSRTPIDTYYANIAAISTGLATSLYLFLRRVGASPLSSLIVSVFFTLSASNIFLVPRVSSFALLILLAGSTLALCFRDSTIKMLSLFMAFTLLVVYARPEFVLSWVLLLVAVFIVIFRRYILGLRLFAGHELRYFVASMLIAGLAFKYFGSPVDGSRSIFAFAQHFKLNYDQWNGIVTHGWGFEAFKLAFGDSKSLTNAAATNPYLFAKHLYYNILHNMPSAARSVFALEMPYLDSKIRKAIPIAVVCAFGAFLWRKLRKTRGVTIDLLMIFRYYKSFLNKSTRIAWPLILVLVPPAISSIIIYPRSHYILFAWPIISILAAGAIEAVLASFADLDYSRWFGLIFPRSIYILAAALLIYLNIAIFTYSRPTPRLYAIESLRSLNLSPPARIVDSGDKISIVPGQRI